jgi:hypothetical protein
MLRISKLYCQYISRQDWIAYTGMTATTYLGKAVINMYQYYSAETEAYTRLVSSVNMHIYA